ncbi:hypothetical protein Pyn_13174 [Prunus yedoensis var. nudiflora]|uniref:LRR receptor-like serine/threonine-protein kinase n=1 Tax=Prunus yedoensis var. nudiflora TaxID=2094558 RepID=A0A314UIU7_PRUYE|nr:hypothetical protein Pyn_13174 [Prunus yedoensis var. nudiflora]
MAQNATTDPSEVMELISIFKQWDMQALPISGGEPGIGFAINGSEFEKPENNPAITCDCTYEESLCSEQTRGQLPSNSFSGPIPKELGNLKDLTVLSFGSNNFSGTLPPELGNLVKLEQFWASNIPFSGKIPAFIGNWTKLTALRINDIYYVSSSLDFIRNLKNLTDLVLRNTLINGRGCLTENVYVFGFGVVALEILCGRPNSDDNLDPEKIYLLEWARNLHENDQSLGLVEPRLTEFDENDATRLIKAALLCTQASSMMRPSMSHVVAILSGDIEASTVMSKPSY